MAREPLHRRRQLLGIPAGAAGLALVASLVGLEASFAGGPDIVGVWAQLDDDTHKDQALIEISSRGGLYVGRIIRYFPDPGEPADPICTACKGDKKGRHIIGLEVIENVRRHGDVFHGGTITDPDDGGVYNVILKPSADGRSLEVTGYLGTPLLGETRVWKKR
jgi:uncharacterized protein (DUF2147 family)